MRLVTFEDSVRRSRIGAIAAEDRVVDLHSACALYLREVEAEAADVTLEVDDEFELVDAAEDAVAAVVVAEAAVEAVEAVEGGLEGGPRRSARLRDRTGKVSMAGANQGV